MNNVTRKWNYSLSILIGCLFISTILISSGIAYAGELTSHMPHKPSIPAVRVVDMDGNALTHEGLIENGMTYIPVKDLSVQLNLKVRWEAFSHTVYIEGDKSDITWSSLTDKMKVNGKDTVLTTYPKIINNKTYIPLRLLQNVFDYHFGWD
ncbi:copper amine oxidase N-terminal domain-containing protein, partial [Paenibacillus sp.]